MGFDIGGVLMDRKLALPEAPEFLRWVIAKVGVDQCFIISRINHFSSISRRCSQLSNAQIMQPPADQMFFCTGHYGERGKGRIANHLGLDLFIDNQLRHLTDIFQECDPVTYMRNAPHLLLFQPSRNDVQQYHSLPNAIRSRIIIVNTFGAAKDAIEHFLQSQM